MQQQIIADISKWYVADQSISRVDRAGQRRAAASRPRTRIAKPSRASDKRKDSGAGADRFEHSVESSEEIAPIHDEQKDNPKKKRQSPHNHKDEESDDDGESHLNLTA